MVVNSCAARGMVGAQRGLALCDVRDKIRQREKGCRQMWGVSLKRERNASVAVCVCVSNTGARLWRRFGNAASSEQRDGRELARCNTATGRSQRPAVVGRASPFRPEEHTFFPSHSARRVSFHYGKKDTDPPAFLGLPCVSAGRHVLEMQQREGCYFARKGR